MQLYNKLPRKIEIFTGIVFLTIAVGLFAQAPKCSDIVIADFTSETFGDWKVEGTAFGTGPAVGILPGQNMGAGFEGKRLANSFHGKDAATGRLTSPSFKIERKYINFLIAGGKQPYEASIKLFIDGVPVRIADGGNSHDLTPRSWDVSEFTGKKATIQIVDNATGDFGRIMVGQIVQADANTAPIRQPLKLAPAKAERKIPLSGDLLILPVSSPDQADKKVGKADWGMIDVIVDGQLIHRAHAVHPRAVEDAKYWAALDMKEFKGKEATLRLCSDLITPEQALMDLNRIESSDKMRHLLPVYKEPGRPQFHFSQIQGWNNDPNGMVYSDGLYHLSWQCNPLGSWFGGWYWGHAVSPDLIHWINCPPILRPNGGMNLERDHSMAVGNCFSGGSAVDVNNTLGKQVGKQKTIIATFADTGLGECLAYSTDGGFRYNYMWEINPITVQPRPENHKGPADRSWGRDPKLFWYEPTKSWVMVVYRMGLYPDACSGHMAFYTSKDAQQWEFLSETEKLFLEIYENGPDKGNINKKDFHECPDFFELPVDGNAKNKKWVLLDGYAKYQVGTFDGKKFTPDLKEYRWTICPGAPYAGQCFSNAPDGRAIMMMWARMGFGDAPVGCGFTLPLELSLRTADDGIRLYVNPVKELEKLRETEIFSAQNKKIGGTESVSFETQEKKVEVVVSVKTDAKTGSIQLKTGETTFNYLLDKRKLDGSALVVHDKDEGRIDFHVFIDSATWEIFAAHGAVYNMGGRNYKVPVGKISVSLNGAEGTLDSLKVYKLKSIWPESVDTLMYSNKK